MGITVSVKIISVRYLHIFSSEIAYMIVLSLMARLAYGLMLLFSKTIFLDLPIEWGHVGSVEQATPKQRMFIWGAKKDRF